MKRTPLKRKTPLKSSKPAKKLPRKKKPTITKVKKKLWDLCREITRSRYGNACYTCNKKGLEGGNWQTGHFIPSSICSVELRYDLDNLRPQCYHCNINLSGNWVAYEAHLMIDKGRDFPTLLKQRNESTKNRQYDILWYENKVTEYQVIYGKENRI